MNEGEPSLIVYLWAGLPMIPRRGPGGLGAALRNGQSVRCAPSALNCEGVPGDFEKPLPPGRRMLLVPLLLGPLE